MVGHEAVAPDIGLGLNGRLAEQVDIKPVVFVLKEDSISPVSTLGNVVRMTRNNDTG